MSPHGSWIVSTEDDAHRGPSLPLLLEALGKMKPETLTSLGVVGCGESRLSEAAIWESLGLGEKFGVQERWPEFEFNGTLPCRDCGTETEWKPFKDRKDFLLLTCPKCGQINLGYNMSTAATPAVGARRGRERGTARRVRDDGHFRGWH